ncbi:hypothetical protein C9374_012439 [Naegleria lovaniensis]|uniref:Uncharacterized protein n=1 Tax=Naegleria lovaniensis TaxID=51637 RepID=A0AA88H2S6_NAELO|nr:uncharacterized protein C9374_012439 [Naegleria lovaniensis]KAG2392187.1 hypothetical protein C9374_012439 [Naegleria lovaniensis]
MARDELHVYRFKGPDLFMDIRPVNACNYVDQYFGSGFSVNDSVCYNLMNDLWNSTKNDHSNDARNEFWKVARYYMWWFQQSSSQQQQFSNFTMSMWEGISVNMSIPLYQAFQSMTYCLYCNHSRYDDFQQWTNENFPILAQLYEQDYCGNSGIPYLSPTSFRSVAIGCYCPSNGYVSSECRFYSLVWYPIFRTTPLYAIELCGFIVLMILCVLLNLWPRVAEIIETFKTSKDQNWCRLVTTHSLKFSAVFDHSHIIEFDIGNYWNVSNRIRTPIPFIALGQAVFAFFTLFLIAFIAMGAYLDYIDNNGTPDAVFDQLIDAVNTTELIVMFVAFLTVIILIILAIILLKMLSRVKKVRILEYRFSRFVIYSAICLSPYSLQILHFIAAYSSPSWSCRYQWALTWHLLFWCLVTISAGCIYVLFKKDAFDKTPFGKLCRKIFEILISKCFKSKNTTSHIEHSRKESTV